MDHPKKYRLHAFLRTLSPLHIASPESMTLNTDTMRPVYSIGKGEGKGSYTTCTGVQKLMVYDKEGKLHSVPVIAANNVIGRLRRHAANKVLEVLESKGERVTIQTYSALTCGAVTGNPDGRDVTFTEYRETRAHPYIGLFGGGPRMMRRYVRAFNAVPYMDATQFMFERVKHPYLDEVVHKTRNEAHRLFQYWTFNRNDDLQQLVNVGRAMASIENFEEEIVKRQALILAGKAKDGAQAEDKSKHSTKTWSAFEFVVPGVVFPLSFELDVTDAQLALFLFSLDAFSKTERIGGHARNGLGQFTLDDVTLVDEDGDVIGGLFNNSALVMEHEFVERLAQAWAAASADLNAADLNRLFSLPEPEAKAAKGRKKAVEVSA